MVARSSRCFTQVALSQACSGELELQAGHRNSLAVRMRGNGFSGVDHKRKPRSTTGRPRATSRKSGTDLKGLGRSPPWCEVEAFWQNPPSGIIVLVYSLDHGSCSVKSNRKIVGSPRSMLRQLVRRAPLFGALAAGSALAGWSLVRHAMPINCCSGRMPIAPARLTDCYRRQGRHLLQASRQPAHAKAAAAALSPDEWRSFKLVS